MLELADEVRLLADAPLLAQVEACRLRLLAVTSDRLELAPGEVLFRQGDPGEAAFAILAGQVEVAAPGQEPRTVGPGALIGERALLCERPHAATAIACGAAEALRIDRAAFSALLASCPQTMAAVLRVLGSREAGAAPA
jgi:CRP-like cAMP-binding protein